MTNLKRWQSLLWSTAIVSSASAGLFFGAGQLGHSDISKYNTMLSQHERVTGEVVIKLNPQGRNMMRTESLAKIFGNFQIEALNVFETNNNFYTVKLASDADTALFLETTNKNPAVAYAEPNYIYRVYGKKDVPEVIPNDVDFTKLWGLKNTGQKDSAGTVGKAGADIGATKAWATHKGSKEIVVAVIDTGVDYNHPDLAANIFQNEAECSKGNNGIDNDGNGFVNDCHGWNFAGVSTNNPMDDNGHGTHVSGTIGARGNDGVGVAGVNWEAAIMPIKFLTGEGSGTLADAVKSIQYATMMGAKVMNNSWGGGGFTQILKDAIEEANKKGLLFIAAAGNDADNADSNPHYPAGYQVENIISVAATTNRDELASFSTYGKRSVHLAAPGNKIYSTIPGGKYEAFSGTSMATPHVAGAAALLWSTDPAMDYKTVKDRLLRSRDYVPAIARRVQTGGRLNVFNAINGIYPPSPEPTEDMWKDAALSKPIASEHPYKDKTKQEWTIEGPADAKMIRVHFSIVDTEAGYDKIQILDASGAEVDTVSGSVKNFSTWYSMGNKLTVKFAADASVNGWGFEIDKIQVIY